MSLRDLKGAFKVWLTALGACLTTDKGWIDRDYMLGSTKRSSHMLCACQTANMFSSCLQCAGDKCFGAAQPTAPSLLRCIMLQSPRVGFLTLSKA